MITTIKVTNHLNESLTLDLSRPEQSGFIVLSLDGLGPPKAELSLTERATADGAAYNSGRVVSRDMVLRLRHYPGFDSEELRQQTYKYFPLNKKIRIDLFTTRRDVYSYGYTESNEPDVFSSEAGTAITVRFPNAYLLDQSPALTSFSSVTPNFEFPWSNESTASPLLEMGSISGDTSKSVVYTGDVSVGMLLQIHATGAASGVVITDEETLETLAIDSTRLAAITGSDIVNGDDIWVSTVKGNKYAELVRGSTTYNVLSALGTSPTWFQLDKGDNVYAYSATSGVTNLQFTIYNEIAYEGV